MLLGVARPQGAQGHRHDRHQEYHNCRRIKVDVSPENGQVLAFAISDLKLSSSNFNFFWNELLGLRTIVVISDIHNLKSFFSEVEGCKEE